jgi:MerR family transcriptional regulator, light-induced transcriptional regulator
MDQRHAFKFDTERYVLAQAVFASKREIFAEDAITSLAREVISRLAEEKSGAADPAQSVGRTLIMPQMVDAFCEVILGHDPAAPLRFLEEVLAPRVAKRNDLYEYIACASRELGEKWEADKVSYLQVTVAAGKLYALVRSVGSNGAETAHAGDRSKNALFASVPGEQHTLGVTIAAEVFRNAGWDIALMIDQSHEALIDRAAAIQPPVMGLSISNSNGLDRLARLVVSMRLTLPDTVIAVAAGPDIDKDVLRNVVDLDFFLTDAESAVVELTKSLRAFRTG